MKEPTFVVIAGIIAIIVNGLILAGAVWLVVVILRAMGVL